MLQRNASARPEWHGSAGTTVDASQDTTDGSRLTGAKPMRQGAKGHRFSTLRDTCEPYRSIHAVELAYPAGLAFFALLVIGPLAVRLAIHFDLLPAKQKTEADLPRQPISRAGW
jgi:hypothetical protein